MRSAIVALTTAASLCLLCSSTSIHSSAELGPQGALFEQALSQAGLSGEQFHVDTEDRSFFGGDKYRLPFFDSLSNCPWKLSPYGRTLSGMLLSSANAPSTVLVGAQARIGQGIRLGLTGDILAPYRERVSSLGEDNLATALVELERSCGNNAAKLEQYKNEAYSSIPAAVRDNAALVLFVLPDALEYRRQALTVPIQEMGLDPQQVFSTVLNSTLADEQNDDVRGALENTLLIEKLLDRTDPWLLNTGATLLCTAAQSAAEGMKAASADFAGTDFIWTTETSLGFVALTGREKLRLDIEYPLLNIAARGNDTYPDEVGATRDYLHAASVSIDLDGDDIYNLPDDHRRPVAAGLFGYGILLDLGGDDNYLGARGTQGFGLFGTGLLYDAGGSDIYSSDTNSQGCGIYGTGVLIDAAGDDQFHCYQYSQGYGFTRGVGLLMDASGNDVYDANDSDIKYGGPQTAEHNTSMSQGMGNGRRGDYIEGHSWAGGVGMLFDGAGDDSYSCGVFGQACAYWYGTGLLVDKAGNDSYKGVWYVQGADAHFGLAMLQDDSGDDNYLATMNMAQGAGHDFSLGWLEDGAGNDHYTAPNLSLGGANANGLGVLWDKGGDDSYRSKGVTLGCAGGITLPSVRGMMLNCGIFVDGGGNDSYEEIIDPPAGMTEPSYRPWDFAGNGKSWTRAGQSGADAVHEYGVAVDAGQG